MIVTKWYRDIGDGMEFNHISTGFNPDHDEPAWVTDMQRRMWLNSLWAPQEAELVDGVLR
jgi:hypothetical protein